MKVNIPLARGRTLTSGFSYFEGTNLKDEIKQYDYTTFPESP
jgi:hypothetical protein